MFDVSYVKACKLSTSVFNLILISVAGGNEEFHFSDRLASLHETKFNPCKVRFNGAPENS